MIAPADITTVLRKRDDLIMDWALSSSGLDRLTREQAYEMWEVDLAFRLLQRGYTTDEAASMLGLFLPYDQIPAREEVAS